MFYKSSLIICNHWNILWFHLQKSFIWEHARVWEWYMIWQSTKQTQELIHMDICKPRQVVYVERVFKTNKVMSVILFSIVFLSLFSNHEKSCKTLQGNPILSVIYCILVFLHKLAKRNYIEKIIWRSTISTFRMKWTAHQFQFYF